MHEQDSRFIEALNARGIDGSFAYIKEGVDGYTAGSSDGLEMVTEAPNPIKALQELSDAKVNEDDYSDEEIPEDQYEQEDYYDE